ncbi:glutaminyl-peptide cyclotransferase-like protein [Auriscalpium vulgare]|uniref:Glutaminyl-peptide cyclotransferase-like protein n=1 Tax=Auriscalpium vulgare TaxID=40419 RepID=A0ACB8R8N9_9AGAM|nr:glutaminyl-peptide cyclotransferase-like protein [Auriscalpium vulgare]
MLWHALILLGLCPTPFSHAASTLGERDLNSLSSPAISTLAQSPDPSRNLDPTNPASHLSKILIPRAPDTANNTLVRNYIASTLRALKWHIEFDSFVWDTPVGPKNFTNVIATKDPDAPRRVVLSAHFDSKYFSTYPQNQFVGATDSAAPCAIMLDLAEVLDPLLDARAKRVADDALAEDEDEDVADTTLQLIFFDGEEAFADWTDTDSIYGARHLAETWATTYLPPHAKRRLLSPSAPATPLSTIEHLVLLDLLGAPHPRVRSFFPDTGWLFDGLVRAEARLHAAGLLEQGELRSFFQKRTGQEQNLGYMGDDHVPFLKRGVSVLHVIAEPFPRVWHTLGDDASALDLPTLRRWNLIMRIFFSEYLGLRPDENDKRANYLEPTPSTPPPLVRKSDVELAL